MARGDKGATTSKATGGAETGGGPAKTGAKKGSGGRSDTAARDRRGRAPARSGGARPKDEAVSSRSKGGDKAPAKPVAKEDKALAREQKREERRGRFGRRLLKIGFLRRRYIKRVLRSIEKSKEKGKRMPPELWDLSKRLDRLPPGKRAEFLEQAITAGPDAQEQAGRAMRRAAASQDRLSGRGGGRARPGMGPLPPGAKRGKPR